MIRLKEPSAGIASATTAVCFLHFSVPELTLANRLPKDIDTMMLTGCYPPIYDRNLSPSDWYSPYVTAYVERDVRKLLKIQDLETFQRFVRLCAGRTGQLLNLSSLAIECGITHNTAKSWISVLEASYLVFLLRPHHASFKKRLVKMPKLYFYDAGLNKWCALAGDKAGRPTLIYAGDESWQHKGIQVLGWRECGQLID